MRKTVSLLLVLLLVASALLFASCRKQQPLMPAEKLQRAIDATQACDALDMTTDMTIGVSVTGISMEIPMHMDVKVKGAQSDSPVASVDMSMEMLGMTMDIPMYIEGEWVYTTMLGESYKAKATSDDTDYTQMAQSFVNDLPAELLEGKEMTVNADGSESVTVDVPPESFAQLFTGALQLAGDTAGTSDDAGSATVKEATVTYTLKDGLIRKCDMAFSMTVVEDGVQLEMSVQASCTYNAFGDDVVITPPEGYLDYPEIDADLLE